MVYSKTTLDARLVELRESGKVYPDGTKIRLSEVTRKRDKRCMNFILEYVNGPFDDFGIIKI